MVPTPYVHSDLATLIRSFEKKFQALAPDIGIIFISINIDRALEGKGSRLKVKLGLSRRFSEAIGLAIVQYVLQKELQQHRLTVEVEIFLGVSGACNDEDVEGASGDAK